MAIASHLLRTKLRPPHHAGLAIARPALEARLAAATERRLTILVAGAGFGKSTLAARVAAERAAAWYTLDRDDRTVADLVAGVVAAVRLAVPALADDVVAPIVNAVEPRDEAEALAQASVAATVVADALHEALDGDLLFVIDDVQAVDDAPAAARFLDTLIRVAPPGLRVLLASRTEPRFSVERLRGQGQVSDVGGPELTFSIEEVAELLRTIVVADDIDPASIPDVARRIHEATGGWPAAVRLAAEAYRSARPEDRADTLERLRRPEGPLFAYLAEEVMSHASEATRELLRRAVHFDRFSVGLLEALGYPNAGRTLGELSRRALFIQRLPGEGDWYALHALIRDFAGAHLPLAPDEIRTLHRRAASWYDANGEPLAALEARVRAGDPPELARHLVEHGRALLLAGANRAIVAAVATIPPDLRDERIERINGEALMILGDWAAAAAAFRRLALPDGRLPAPAAWRLGLLHGLRGMYTEALAIYDRAVEEDAEPVDTALLHAWISSARYHRGEAQAAEAAARISLEAAERSGDPRAIAAGHTALGQAFELVDEPHRARGELSQALAAAERGGDAIQVVRIRDLLGALDLEAGRFGEAFAQLDEAVRLAEATGFASFHARTLTNRGRAHLGSGRFEQAVADFAAARAIYDRIDSPMVANALLREAGLHLLRGDGVLARTGYEQAVRAARESADHHVLAPALLGLAQTVALDEPDEARRLVAEGLEVGRDVARMSVLLGAARTALALGDRAAADGYAADAAAGARAREDHPGLAAALELRGMTVIDRAAAIALVEEAAAIWRASPSPYGLARNRLILARVADGDVARAAATEAERVFRELGARGPAAEAAARLDELARSSRPPVAIQALGRFRVLRDGEVVPLTAWQSKKARDLVKIIVARRGRPTTRETLFELLWPEERDPGPLANRLSVALAVLRGVLDPSKTFAADHFVVADKSALSLDLAHVDVDVERFLGAATEAERAARHGDAASARAALEEAEALYTGDFLEEDPYEDWAVDLREEARATYIWIARARAAAAAAAGHADEAARFYLRILERDAFDEEAHLGLVAALGAAGRHGEARRRYGLYVSRMEEIGVEAAPYPSARGAAGASAAGAAAAGGGIAPPLSRP